MSVPFAIHVLDQSDRLLVTDIDGTITQSDLRGFVLPAVGMRADHAGVVRLLDGVGRRGYTVVYLTARSMALADMTRSYLFNVSAVRKEAR